MFSLRLVNESEETNQNIEHTDLHISDAVSVSVQVPGAVRALLDWPS